MDWVNWYSSIFTGFVVLMAGVQYVTNPKERVETIIATLLVAPIYLRAIGLI